MEMKEFSSEAFAAHRSVPEDNPGQLRVQAKILMENNHQLHSVVNLLDSIIDRLDGTLPTQLSDPSNKVGISSTPTVLDLFRDSSEDRRISINRLEALVERLDQLI
jgi:hypothetical protein